MGPHGHRQDDPFGIKLRPEAVQLWLEKQQHGLLSYVDPGPETGHIHRISMEYP